MFGREKTGNKVASSSKYVVSWKLFHRNISLFVLNTLSWNHKLTSFQVWEKIPSFKARLLQFSD